MKLAFLACVPGRSGMARDPIPGQLFSREPVHCIVAFSKDGDRQVIANGEFIAEVPSFCTSSSFTGPARPGFVARGQRI